MDKRIERAAIIISLAVLAFVFINYLSIGMEKTFHPFEIGYDEADLFLHSQNFYEGNLYNMYKDIKEEPLYQSNDYPPVYHIACGTTYFLFGPNLWSCRLISLLSALGAGILVYLIMFRLTSDRKLSVAVMLLAYASNITFYWSAYMRNDYPALFLALLGFYVVMRNDWKHNIKIASIIFIVAFYTKQTYIAAPLACMIYFYFKDRKALKEMVIFYTVPLAASFIIINLLTNWQFYVNIVAQNSHRVGYLRQTVFDIIAENIILIGLGFAYLLSRRDIFSIFFALSFGLAMFQSLNPVGWTQYFIELVFAASICIGLLFHKHRDEKSVRYLLFALVAINVAIALCAHPNLYQSALYPQEHAPIRNMEADIKILSYVMNSSGNVIIEHGYFSVLGGKPMLLPELWNIIEYEFMGLIKPQEFIDYMVERNVTMIAFREKRLKTMPLIRDFLKNDFIFADEIGWMDDVYNSTWEIYIHKAEDI